MVLLLALMVGGLDLGFLVCSWSCPWDVLVNIAAVKRLAWRCDCWVASVGDNIKNISGFSRMDFPVPTRLTAAHR